MILVCGDCLIDFMPAKTADGREAYVPAVGGSCLNIAVAAGRLGAQAGFVGGISTDMFGEMIAEHMLASNVDISRTSRTDHETTLAFVKYVGTQARYAFYDKDSAARMWRFDPTNVPLDGVEALHIGSTTLINDPAGAETKRLAEAARGSATIALDPNCRPSMIADVPAYRQRIDALVRLADIVKVSVEDLDYLRPEAAPEAAAADWLAAGPSLVLITNGGDGSTAYTKLAQVHRAATPVKVADTIGAGDTFHAALLVWLSEHKTLAREALKTLTARDLGEALVFAGAAAAITCSRPGADPPWRKELDV